MAGTKGRSGRPPKPTARKVLAGNPGKRALNKHEPKYSKLANIEPPDWLDDTARTMWVMLCEELCSQGVLHVTDIHNLELFCCSYSNWRSAQSEVALYGVTIEEPDGKRKKNPAMTAVNEAARQIATFGAMLGLDPGSRQRLIGGSKSQDSENRFSEFL